MFLNVETFLLVYFMAEKVVFDIFFNVQVFISLRHIFVQLFLNLQNLIEYLCFLADGSSNKTNKQQGDKNVGDINQYQHGGAEYQCKCGREHIEANRVEDEDGDGDGAVYYPPEAVVDPGSMVAVVCCLGRVNLPRKNNAVYFNEDPQGHTTGHQDGTDAAYCYIQWHPIEEVDTENGKGQSQNNDGAKLHAHGSFHFFSCKGDDLPDIGRFTEVIAFGLLPQGF